MKRSRPKTFSRLHEKAIGESRVIVTLSTRLRSRLWQLLCQFNDSLGVQRDPNNTWIDNSDVATEIVQPLCYCHGWDSLKVVWPNGVTTNTQLKVFFDHCPPALVFDVIQLWYDELDKDRRHALQEEINALFEEESCPWCFCDREFFQIDSKFLEQKILIQAHELLKDQAHLGAMQEFVEARNDFSAGDFKGTILNSCKAYESVMKTILEREGGSAGDLIKELDGVGILNDLPPALRKPFEKNVLQSVPFLRNTLAGHGQGAQIVGVSRDLAELCLHFSGALILFCVRRQLALTPPATAAVPSEPPPDSDVPF